MSDQRNILLRRTVTLNPKAVVLVPVEVAGKVVGGDGVLVEFFQVPRAWLLAPTTIEDLDKHRRIMAEQGWQLCDDLEHQLTDQAVSSDDIGNMSLPEQALLLALLASTAPLVPALFLVWVADEVSRSIGEIAREPVRWLRRHLP
jgi:hypothetical protein